MQADGISVAGPNVTGAIQKAAQLTGANFGYLVATAQAESNLNPNAAASTSSAGGLFQFLDQTWLSTVKQAGSTFGYAAYANAISQSTAGTYTVSDPKMRQAVMQLRDDPNANSVMAGVFTNQNAAKLAAQIGRPPNQGELYIAHFLGASGAAKLIGAASATPAAPAAAMFPAAASANPAIFYDRQGGARGAGQVYSILIGKFAAAKAALGPPAATGAATVPDTAGTTNAYATVNAVATPGAADNGPGFHSLFQTGDRGQPIDPLVSQLWSSQSTSTSAPQSGSPTTPGASSGSGSAVGPGLAGGSGSAGVDVLGLFQTQPTNSRALFGGGGS